MVDNPGRQWIEIYVGQTVGTYDHRAVLRAESIHKFLHCVLIRIHIVRVQLEGKTPAERIIDCGIPVAANGVVGVVLRNINKPLV